MFCPKCGSMVEGNVCGLCGAQISGDVQQPTVGGYGGAQRSYGAYGGAPGNPYSGASRNYVADFSDFLVPNIILTIVAACLCRLIGAIVPGIGLLFSILSRNALAAGDIALARSRAVVAKVFFWISLVLIIFAIISVAYYLSTPEGQARLRELQE